MTEFTSLPHIEGREHRANPVRQPALRPRGLVWIDRNAIIYLSTLIAGVAVALVTGQVVMALVVPVTFLVVTEVLYFGLGLQVYSHQNRVRRAYEWFDTYLDGAYGEGRDLTEAYFDGNTSKPFEQALQDKFDKFIELLGLQPGAERVEVAALGAGVPRRVPPPAGPDLRPTPKEMLDGCAWTAYNYPTSV